MALQEQQAEPSMEEILASIRRIISEEEEAPSGGELELTQEADDDLLVAADMATAASAEPVRTEDDIVFDEDEAQALPPEPPVARAPAVAVAPAPIEQIVSPPNANAAAGALARLAGQLRISETQGQTLEGVVRELLKPMLADWLDQNLARIVEARVEAELERIARMAR